MSTGLWTYIGIEENIDIYLRRNASHLLEEANNITLPMKVNVDGLPLYRSSTTSIWPILVSFGSDVQPYPVAIHVGEQKPDLNAYMKDFIKEVQELRQDGHVFGNSIVKLGTIIFVCDAPARAHLQCVFGHTAKKGCSYCNSEGRYLVNRVVYSTTVGQTRTDERYHSHEENNQVALSPLSSIVGLNSHFPVDDLHCICLGVFRRICHYYFSKVKNFNVSCKLKTDQIRSLSDEILQYRDCTPSEFQRKLRSLDYLIHYKGTEFRSLLLYFSPFLFKKYLSEKVYQHLLLLHCSYYIFVCDRHTQYYAHAHRCLEIFVREHGAIFGEHSVSYNVHSLLHIYEFVQRYGPVSNFSTFKFENYLGKLKRRIKVTRHNFPHIIEQARNLRDFSVSTSPLKLKYSDSSPNNFCVIGENYVKIDRLHSDGSVTGHVLCLRKDLYVYPYPSRRLGIGHFALTKRILKGLPTNKCFCFPVKDEFVLFPFA